MPNYLRQKKRRWQSAPDMAMAEMTPHAATYYHGGAPDLTVGDTILPAEATGANPRGATYQTSKVFFTTDRRLAWLYAVLYPARTGTIYTVKPVGEVTLDPERNRAEELCSDSACILDVIGQPWHASPDDWWKAEIIPAEWLAYMEAQIATDRLLR